MKNFIPLTILVPIFFFSCKEDNIDPTQSFFKIYDTQRSDVSFRPIDIVQTSEGFIVIAEQEADNSSFMGLQVIQLDEFGNYLVETVIPGQHFAPVGEFITIDSSYYFFTMDDLNRAQLVKMGNDPSVAEVIPLTGGLQYPLAANKTAGNDLMLLSYNSADLQTVLSIIDIDGNLTAGNGYTIGAGSDVEARIIQHFEDPERYGLPFFCGPTGIGSYYFNGFYNYTLSVVFTDLSSSTPAGVIQGQQIDNGGITALLPLTTSTFSLFGFQFNDNFIQPAQTINTTDISSSIDYMILPFNEFKSRTPAKIRSYTSNGVVYSVVAAESQSRSVVLYFYDIATGDLSGIHTIGYHNPYTLGSIKVDADNNIVILGTTLLSSRISRLFVNKLSSEEIAAILN